MTIRSISSWLAVGIWIILLLGCTNTTPDVDPDDNGVYVEVQADENDRPDAKKKFDTEVDVGGVSVDVDEEGVDVDVK